MIFHSSSSSNKQYVSSCDLIRVSFMKGHFCRRVLDKKYIIFHFNSRLIFSDYIVLYRDIIGRRRSWYMDWPVRFWVRLICIQSGSSNLFPGFCVLFWHCTLQRFWIPSCFIFCYLWVSFVQEFALLIYYDL